MTARTPEDHGHVQELEATVKRLRARIVRLKAVLGEIADAREPMHVLQALARTVLRRQGELASDE